MSLYYKMENLQRSGRLVFYLIVRKCYVINLEYLIFIFTAATFVANSFKSRGILCGLLRVPENKKNNGVIIASLGNEALGLCYYTQEHKIKAYVVMPVNVPLSLREKITNLGAKIMLFGRTLAEADSSARKIALKNSLTYINRFDFKIFKHIRFYDYYL